MDMGLVCGIRPPITRQEVFLGCIPVLDSALALAREQAQHKEQVGKLARLQQIRYRELLPAKV